MDISNYKRTSRPPQVVDGITFLGFRTGILRYADIDEASRAYVARRHDSSTYYASVDDKPLLGRGGKAKKFRTREAALRAAAAIIKGQPKVR